MTVEEIVSSYLTDCLRDNKLIQQSISAVAARNSIPLFDLRVKTLLHLPRFSSLVFFENPNEVYEEITRLSDTIASQYAQLGNSFKWVSSTIATDYDIRLAREEEVNLFIGKLHYLGSIRKNSINLALENRSTGIAIGVICFSIFDLHHISVHPYSAQEALVVSRVYTINQAPYNINSYFIGLAARWVKLNLPEVKLLVTYLNRNLGFNGTLYKSTNWRLLACENDTRYSYYNDNYVTDRFLVDQFGTSNNTELTVYEKISFSKVDLEPLEVYYLPLCRKLRDLNFQNVMIDRVK